MLDNFLYAAELLPVGLKQAIERLSFSDTARVSEIRLRSGGFLSVKLECEEMLVTYGGKLSKSSVNAVSTYKSDVEFVFERAFESSVYSFERELKEGFITVHGGNRVGFSSSFVFENGGIKRIADITGVNIRIAKEALCCSSEIFDRLGFNKPISLLVCGPPASGKTTQLRDITRVLGNRFSVTLIDERGEIACAKNGVLQNDVGRFTDVLSGVDKAQGIRRAIRLLSPVFIVTDEIGAMDELSAFEYAENSGVKIIASTHADSIDGALSKPLIKKLCKRGFFDAAVFLNGNRRIENITPLREKINA